MDGVVTLEAFKCSIYTGRVVLGELSSSEAITAIMEFVRLADMCGISGVEYSTEKHITKLILENSLNIAHKRCNAETWCFQVQHVASAAALTRGHLVRNTLAAAAAKGYVHFKDKRFVDKAEEYPDFSVDVFVAMKAASRALPFIISATLFAEIP